MTNASQNFKPYLPKLLLGSAASFHLENAKSSTTESQEGGEITREPSNPKWHGVVAELKEKECKMKMN